jgi:hypothetical protein
MDNRIYGGDASHLHKVLILNENGNCTRMWMPVRLNSNLGREENGLAIVLFIRDFNGLNLHTELTKVFLL